jgi:tripeptidyl-peptidase-1
MMVVVLLMVIDLCTCHIIDKSSIFYVKESHSVPIGWGKKGVAPAHHILKLRIALKQGNFAELEKKLIQCKSKYCLHAIVYALLNTDLNSLTPRT